MAIITTDVARESLLGETTDRFPLNDDNSLRRRRNQARQNRPCSSPSIGSKQQFSLNQVIALLTIYLGFGTLSFFLVRHQIRGKKTNDVLDALYFCIVTMTTVGYGDLVPSTVPAKLLACLYVFIGMAIVGLMLGKAADHVLDKQEIILVRAIHMRERLGQAELIREAESRKVEYKFLVTLAHFSVLVIVGTSFLCYVEGLAFMDAFYCVCSTITTLGYGDESFSTGSGRFFAVFWILGSTVCLAQLFLYAAELFTESRRKSLVKWVLDRDFTRSDLEAADLDHDKIVSAAEFVLYKLREMGKIEEEDISVLMETFKKLDVDHSGTLTASDLTTEVS